MNRWFQKGNARRFFRIDMPVKVFVQPASPLKDPEIYANGSHYYTPALRQKLSNEKNALLKWIEHIQDKKEPLKAIFHEILAEVEFFGEISDLIAQGINPKQHSQYWLRLQKQWHGFESLNHLLPDAPKTHAYFQKIEQSFTIFYQSMQHTLQHSGPNHFETNAHLPDPLPMAAILKLFSDEKYRAVPLVRAIYHLGQYMTLHLEAFRQLNDDQIRRHSPELWPLKTANLSASGIAVPLQQSFKPFEKVDVLLYFAEDKKRLHFDGSIVNTRSMPEEGTEQVAINFELPDGDDQAYLQNAIQEFELEECLDLVLS
ncbi:MAG: PilZ domain-containing protein [Hydrogenovibrio sp.]|uniref:PilZ domain-containing protein n=1 Tax=Hydrogenovibrio sp. TaxID=2065821 RepID=UPI002870B333|nr:PilZ domain-containing protein [Hydrogenovibrio sp.]MDR9498022.1 PilZ domain-containing protein [Hydrogenovibrio sp.]